ncbi:MAG: hypothetical protein FWC27_11360, partial [Firmicutes bacterium]|nr:hypothetical protein [Bacillota bacterium]
MAISLRRAPRSSSIKHFRLLPVIHMTPIRSYVGRISRVKLKAGDVSLTIDYGCVRHERRRVPQGLGALAFWANCDCLGFFR